MAYVVIENCIKCKYQDCVEVCPVDCFYEGANFLVINPEECIDCGVCEPECPAEAICPDSDPRATQTINTAKFQETTWAEFNRNYATKWPNITKKGAAPADADSWNGKAGKAAQLSVLPGN